MSDDIDRITPFIEGKKILVSGGTGFVGKVFIEKILRTCPDIGKIYILIRNKHGKNPDKRLEEIFDSPLFMKIEAEMDISASMAKCKVISGDMSLINLGLSEEDHKEITENVDLIYNLAASVRFNEPLKVAILNNTRGTREMLALAKQCKHLKLFLHMSTAYTHPQENVLKDAPYNPPKDPHKLIHLAETLEEHHLDSIAKNLIGDYPNTYSFSKALSEGLVNEVSMDLPTLIVRPSILMPILFEPVPGFVDSLMGPTAISLASAAGVLRVINVDPDVVLDLLPVDIVANTLCVSSFNFVHLKDRSRKVTNYVNAGDVKLTCGEFNDVGSLAIKKYPFDYVLWYPSVIQTKSFTLYKFLSVFLHWIPAYIVDVLLFCLGYPMILVKIQKKIAMGIDVLKYYMNKEWHFENDGILHLRSILNRTEKMKYCTELHGVDTKKYSENVLLSMRRYTMKNSDDTLPRARKVMTGLYYADRIVKILFVAFCLYYLFKLVELVL